MKCQVVIRNQITYICLIIFFFINNVMGFLNDIFYNPRTHDLMNPKKFQTILFLIRILRWANTIFSISKHFSFIKDFHLYYDIFRAVLQSKDLQLQSLFSDIQKYSADPPQRTCRHTPTSYLTPLPRNTAPASHSAVYFSPGSHIHTRT